MLIALIWYAFIWICFAYSMYAGENKFTVNSPMVLVPILAMAYILAIFSYIYMRKSNTHSRPNDTYTLANVNYVENGPNDVTS